MHEETNSEADEEECAPGNDCKGKQAEAECTDGNCMSAKGDIRPEVVEEIIRAFPQ